MNTLTISFAKLTDIYQVHKLYQNLSESSKKTYHSKIYGIPNGYVWFIANICMLISHTPLVKYWRKYYPKYIYYTFVAKDGGNICGFSHYVLHGVDKAGRLSANIGIAVSDEYQGKGIGTALFNEMLSHAKKEKINLLFLDVVMNNEKAVKLYSKFGFNPVLQKSGDIIHMECILNDDEAKLI